MQVHVIQRQPSGLQPIDENSTPAIVVADMRPAPTIADTVLAYFAGLGAPPLKQGFNPADHLLLAVDTLEENGVDVSDLYEESKELKQVWEVVAQETKAPRPLPVIASRATFGAQLGLLCKRYFISQWRDPRFTFFRLAWYALTAMFIGTTFIRLGCSLNDAVYRIAALFFAVYAAVVPMQVAVVPLVKERAIVYREHVSGTYSAWADGISRFLVDIPFHAVMAVLFFAIFYYAVGLNTSPEATGYFVLMIFFAFWTLTSFGQVSALLSPNVETANGLAGLVILLSTFLMGFLIPVRLMPNGWKWAVWVNMLYYILQGLCVNELNGQYIQLNLGSVSFSCGPPEMITPYSLPTMLPGGALLNADNLTSTSIHDQVALRGSLPPQQSASITLPCQDYFDSMSSNFTQMVTCVERNGCADSRSPATCVTVWCGAEVVHFLTATQEAVGCLPKPIQEVVLQVATCLIENIHEPDPVSICVPNANAIIAFLRKFIPVIRIINKLFGLDGELMNWLLYLFLFGTVFIPANLILWFFGWAHLVDGEGLVADTQWWYCMFALCMFLVGWETIKILARRYVRWVRR